MQCTVGVVSIRCLLCTKSNIVDTCDHLEDLFITFTHSASYEMIHHAPCLIKTYSVSNTLIKTENTKVEVLRNVSLNLISPGETGHSKTYLG